MTNTTTAPKLSRPRSGRVIGGVCAGIARRFGWDPTIVRIAAVLSVLIPGPQVIIYLAMWLLIPNDAETVVTTSSSVV